jgi:hypothetical protein
MKNFIKKYLEKINSHYFEQLASYSIIKENFQELRKVKNFNDREKLWKNIFSEFQDQKITILEFGVWKGYSLNQFSKLNLNPKTTFYGFDSFLGLPENWGKNLKKGSFNNFGNIPKIEDKRVEYINGWFQNTLPVFLESSELSDELFVHFDADIFSSTLYVMLELDRLKTDYYAIFDEFPGHETRALNNYLQISGANVKFLSSSGNKKYPMQVCCKIYPVKEFKVK